MTKQTPVWFCSDLKSHHALSILKIRPHSRKDSGEGLSKSSLRTRSLVDFFFFKKRNKTEFKYMWYKKKTTNQTRIFLHRLVKGTAFLIVCLFALDHENLDNLDLFMLHLHVIHIFIAVCQALQQFSQFCRLWKVSSIPKLLSSNYVGCCCSCFPWYTENCMS